MTPTLGQSLDLVREAFTGKVDKGGEPYWKHCVRVMLNLPDDATEDERHAALLHDILEDTDVDLAAKGYSATILRLVAILTRGNADLYDDYIRRISQDRRATRIKMADLTDNLDPSRPYRMPAAQRERYHVALGMLYRASRLGPGAAM